MQIPDAPQPDAPKQEILMVAGEASGDLHGARLLSALRRKLPGVQAFGLGGDEMAAAGFEPLAHSSEIAVVGIVEVLKILKRARQIFDTLLEEVDRRGIQWAVLIDSPDFNLRLAKQLRRRGVRVIYYISPQVWAWRKRRIHAIARDIDLMLVLFPFEVDFYRSHRVDVRHVGHPLVEEIPQPDHIWDARRQTDRRNLALLPGSRRSEIQALLPWMLDAAARLAELRRRDGVEGELVCRLIQAPNIPQELFERLIEDSGVETRGLRLERVQKDRLTVLADCHLALCASGTATLEVALLGTPMLVMYRLKWTSYWLGRLLVKLPHFCMVNLVLDRRVVPEMLQSDARPHKVAAEAHRLLSSREAIDAMREGLARLRPALGETGASERAAAAVAERLRPNAPPPLQGEA